MEEIEIKLPPYLQGLVEKGKIHGFVSYAEILQKIPNPESKQKILDDLFNVLFSGGSIVMAGCLVIRPAVIGFLTAVWAQDIPIS